MVLRKFGADDPQMTFSGSTLALAAMVLGESKALSVLLSFVVFQLRK